jgi:hypothetical protein
MLGGIEFQGTGAMCLPMALELFQRLNVQAGLGMMIVIAWPVLGFISLVPISRVKSCTYYHVLPPVNGVLLHEAGVVLVKVDLGLHELMLSWVIPESHSCKDLHSLRFTLRPMPQLVVMETET